MADGWLQWAELAFKNNSGFRCADSVSIVGLDGATWTTKCEDEKVAGTINVDAKLLADIKSLFAVGISETTSKLTINGKNFLIIAADEKEIVGKCGGSAGLTIAKATKCFVIGLYTTKDVSPEISIDHETCTGQEEVNCIDYALCAV
ncbi:hypothetical protein ScPMuIL_018302 [Solemya velum]